MRCTTSLSLAAALLCSGAMGDTLVRNPGRDATLILPACGEGLTHATPANGGGEWFFAGSTGSLCARRGALWFDVSAIPAGSLVTAVTITLDQGGSNEPPQAVSFHRCLADWGEGTTTVFGGSGGGAAGGTPTAGGLTWAHRSYPSTLWTTPGGDFAATASASRSVAGPGSYMWTSTGLRDDVQGWVNGASPNHGWIVIGNEAAIHTAKKFRSRENSQSRPQLTVTYTPVQAGACCLSGGACVILTPMACTGQSGMFRGIGTNCTPNLCPPPCPADWDGNGLVQPTDIAAFVNSWFAGLSGGGLAADFNGNGALDPSDVASFVTAWFNAVTSGC